MNITTSTMARLKRQLKRLNITHDQVAAEASLTSRRGHVGRTLVVHVLAGRAKSANVVKAARQLIARAQECTAVEQDEAGAA